ncbi:hypothetical protein LTR94_029373, partial [Friedmanniomyces endolithicus]
PARRRWIAQEGKKFSDLAKLLGRGSRPSLQRDPHGDAFDGPKEVGEAGNGADRTIRHDRLLKQERRPAVPQDAGLDFCHFQNRRDRFAHPDEFALSFQLFNEVTQ